MSEPCMSVQCACSSSSLVWPFPGIVIRMFCVWCFLVNHSNISEQYIWSHTCYSVCEAPVSHALPCCSHVCLGCWVSCQLFCPGSALLVFFLYSALASFLLPVFSEKDSISGFSGSLSLYLVGCYDYPVRLSSSLTVNSKD